MNDKINELHAAIDRLPPLLAEAQMHKDLQSQGIDPAQVDHLTFQIELLDYVQRKEVRKAGRRDEFPPAPFENMLNAAVMKDGTVVRLNPMLKRHV
jgi:hypothetical protein